MPILQRRIQFHFAAAAGEMLLGPLSSTWKVTVEDPEGVLKSILEKRRVHIAAFWHRYLLTMLCVFRGYPVCVPVSRHNDAEYVAHLMNRYGLRTARGSTTRGSLQMIRDVMRRLKAGDSCAITPDGPRGPVYSVQPGLVLLSRRSGVPVYPVGIAVNRGWIAGSWDRLVIPKPYARIGLAVGRELTFPPEMRVEEACELFRSQLVLCTEKAARHAGATV